MAKNVRNTRTALHEALLGLVVERPYESITVQDILDRAGVGRTTFYLHFRDKDDLLFCGMEPLRDLLLHRMRAAPGDGISGVLDFTSELFREGERVFEPYRALSGTPMGTAARNRIFSMLTDALAESLLRRGGAREASSARVAAHYLAGAIMGLVEWWMEQPAPPGGAELHRTFVRLARPTIEALLHG